MPASTDTLAAPANQAAGRQRRDGSRPSGNSSSPNVAAGPMPAIHTQVESQRDERPALSPCCETVTPPTA